MDNKERMIADTPQKGLQRSFVIRDAIDRYKKALKSGFYLEAITIAESLITDRMESRAVFLGMKDSSFQTIGVLCKKLKEDSILSALLPEIDDWRKLRNNALHALAKIEDGDYTSFQKKYHDTQAVAENGIKIFRKLDRTLKKSRIGG